MYQRTLIGYGRISEDKVSCQCRQVLFGLAHHLRTCRFGNYARRFDLPHGPCHPRNHTRPAHRGVGQRRKTALLTVVGMIFVAGAVQVSLLVLGLASLVAAYPSALAALQWAGAE